MIAILLSKDSFAVFSVVTNLFQVISIIRNSLAQVVTPAMSKTESMGDAERTLKINNNANIAACVIIFPICCFLFLFAHEIITLLFTSNYSDAAPVLRIYIFALILSGIDLSSFLVILKKGPFVLKTNVAFGAFSLIISYIGIHALGMPGVAIGSVMTLFLVKCLNIYVVSKEIKVSIKQLQPWKVFTQLLLSSLISSVLTYLISHYYPPQFSHYILLPLSGLLFGLIYLLCLKAFGLEWIIKWFLKTK